MRHKQLRSKGFGLPGWGQEKCQTEPTSQDHPFKFQPEVQSCLLQSVSFVGNTSVSNTEGQRDRMMDFLACLLPC